MVDYQTAVTGVHMCTVCMCTRLHVCACVCVLVKEQDLQAQISHPWNVIIPCLFFFFSPSCNVLRRENAKSQQKTESRRLPVSHSVLRPAVQSKAGKSPPLGLPSGGRTR